MEGILRITNALACFVEAWFQYQVVIEFSTYRRTPKKWELGIWWFLFGVFVVCFNDDANATGTILAELELLIFGVLYMRERIFHCAFLTATGILMIACVDTLVGTVYLLGSGMTLGELTSSVTERGIITIVTKLVLIFFGFLLFRFHRRRRIFDFGLWEFLWALIGWIIVLGMASMMFAVEDQRYYYGLLAVFLITTLLDVFVYCALDRMQNLGEQKLLYELEIQEQQLTAEHYADSRDIYRAFRERRHDMKHHIGYLEYLMEQKEYDKAKAYLTKERR